MFHSTGTEESHAAHSWRMEPSKCALLVIDVQERLAAAMHEKDALIRKVIQAVAGCVALDVPVYYSEQYPKGLGPTLPSVKAASPGVLTREKLRFSASELVSEISQPFILVCGMEAHVCVRQTVYDIREKGKIPVLLTDATGSREPFTREMALQEMMRDGVILSTVESVLFELIGGADHPKFKVISGIVK